MWKSQIRMQVCLSALVLAGCHDVTWRDQAPDDELTATEITRQDLGLVAKVPTSAPADDPSEIIFPTGLAVVRVGAAMENANGKRFLLASNRPDQQAYWNQLFNDLPSIREVVVLTSNGLNPAGFGQKDIFRRAATQNCRLCLIYARVAAVDGDSPSEFAAVLWDAHESKLLATYQVPIGVEGDENKVDPDDRAESDLRDNVRDTVWTLAKKHEPSIDTKTSPWGTNAPMLPRTGERYRFLERLREKHPTP